MAFLASRPGGAEYVNSPKCGSWLNPIECASSCVYGTFVISERYTDALNFLGRIHVVAKMSDVVNEVRSAKARTLIRMAMSRS